MGPRLPVYILDSCLLGYCSKQTCLLVDVEIWSRPLQHLLHLMFRDHESARCLSAEN